MGQNWKPGKILPFTLTAFVLLLDQVTKSVIVKNWPVIGTKVADIFGNDFLCIYHVRNKVIAFSLGESLPETIRPILFIVFPLLVVGFLIWYYMTSSEFTKLQRWAIAGVIGGGAGNLLDRIFRPDGVVDFISVKFYGFLGFQRWPTFNVADSAVVVCVLIWLISVFLQKKPVVAEESAAAGAENGEVGGD